MKIAFICAFPAGSNPGMLSVDLAIETVRSKLPSNTVVDRFCAWRSIVKPGMMPMNYNLYYSLSQLENYDKIVFWGDFLHWRGYAYADFLSRGRGKAKNTTDNDIIDQWYQLYLFENCQHLQQRTIVFGSTLYALGADDINDQRYMSALTSLYKNSKLSLMRDLVSANFIDQIANNDRSNFGCDCAALLEVDHLVDSKSDIDAPYLTYALGRSGHTDILQKFTFDISEKLGTVPINLNWLEKGVGVDNTIKKISLIKHSTALITDIYHCAITAWREGTPVICIGHASSRVSGTLSDKKKEILHMQLFSIKNYVYIEEILKNSNKLLPQQCADIIKYTGNVNTGHSTLIQQKRQALDKLISALT